MAHFLLTFPPVLLFFVLMSSALHRVRAESYIHPEDLLAPSLMYQRILRMTSSRLLHSYFDGTSLAFDSMPALKAAISERNLQRSFVESNNNLADECARDMAEIFNASASGFLTALKYIDSTATRPSGMLAGNLRWFGDFDECRSISSFVSNWSNATISPKYCRLGIAAINSSYVSSHETIMPLFFGLILGVCVSSTCQVGALAGALNPLFYNASMKVYPEASHCYEDDMPYTGVSIFVIFLFSLIALCLLIGLAVDLYFRLKAWRDNLQQIAEAESLLLPSDEHHVIFHAAQNLASIDKAKEEAPLSDAQKPAQSAPPQSLFVKVALCFSPFTNFLKIVTLPTSKQGEETPNLTALNGIRALSLFWVILGHTYVFTFLIFDNLLEAAQWMSRISFMFVVTGYFAVDTFLFLSGFLAYWSMIKQFTASGSFWRRLGFVYLHRYIRLIGPYLGIILIDLGLWAHLSTGPTYFQGEDYGCANNWWTNLLYINNFAEVKYQCVPWSWYLSVDMQLFLITPFVVYLFNRNHRHGWYACFGLLAVQIVTAIPITIAYNMPSNLNAPVTNLNASLAKDYENYYEIIYVKPYLRLAPQVVGIMTAHVAMNHSFELSRRIFGNLRRTALMWLLMFGLFLTLTYSQFDVYAGNYVNPIVVDALFNAFARIAWGLALGWLVLACAFNQAGIVSSILAWPYWAIPARLSYSGYLVHPLILLFYGQTSRRAFHATDLTMIFVFFAMLIATMLVAILHSLAFESPVIGLQRLLMNKSKSNKK